MLMHLLLYRANFLSFIQNTVSWHQDLVNSSITLHKTATVSLSCTPEAQQRSPSLQRSLQAPGNRESAVRLEG